MQKPIAKHDIVVKYVDVQTGHIIFAAIPDIYEEIVAAGFGPVTAWVSDLSLLDVGTLYDVNEVADWMRSLGGDS